MLLLRPQNIAVLGGQVCGCMKFELFFRCPAAFRWKQLFVLPPACSTNQVCLHGRSMLWRLHGSVSLSFGRSLQVPVIAQSNCVYAFWQVPRQAGGNSKILWVDHTARQWR
jgi:hypothetical protein